MGAWERVGPTWEESAQKEGERGKMEEWPIVSISSLDYRAPGRQGSLPRSLSYPAAWNREKPASPTTPEGEASLPSTGAVKHLCK